MKAPATHEMYTLQKHVEGEGKSTDQLNFSSLKVAFNRILLASNTTRIKAIKNNANELKLTKKEMDML